MKEQDNESQYLSLAIIREQLKKADHSITFIGRLSRQDRNTLLKEGNQVIEVNDGGQYRTTIEWL